MVPFFLRTFSRFMPNGCHKVEKWGRFSISSLPFPLVPSPISLFWIQMTHSLSHLGEPASIVLLLFLVPVRGFAPLILAVVWFCWSDSRKAVLRLTSVEQAGKIRLPISGFWLLVGLQCLLLAGAALQIPLLAISSLGLVCHSLRSGQLFSGSLLFMSCRSS